MTIRNDLHVKRSERGHAGAGWYAWLVDYPDEGSYFFDHQPNERELDEALPPDEVD
jgi:hypothetical protein